MYRILRSTREIYLIGEDIERRAGRLALRSMSDPKVKGNQILMAEQIGKQSECGTPHKQMIIAGSYK
jgi:Zn-dependent metalloprotease